MLEKQAEVIRALKERLEEHAASKKATQDEVEAAFATIRKQLDDFEKKIIADFQEKFAAEDSRLQRTLDDLQSFTPKSGESENQSALEEAIQKASAELAVRQKYSVENIQRVASYVESLLVA